MEIKSRRGRTEEYAEERESERNGDTAGGEKFSETSRDEKPSVSKLKDEQNSSDWSSRE